MFHGDRASALRDKKFLGTAAAMAGQAHECTDAAELRLKDGRRDRPVKKEAGRVANRRHSPPAQGAPRSPDRVAPSSWRSPPDPSCGTRFALSPAVRSKRTEVSHGWGHRSPGHSIAPKTLDGLMCDLQCVCVSLSGL